MKRLREVVFIFVAIVVAALAYVRFAPIHILKAHVEPQLGQPVKQAASVDQLKAFYVSQNLLGFPGENMRKMDAIIMRTPRTKVLNGSVSSGMVTYVTRSAVFGFPDLTTVKVEPTPEGTHMWLFGRAIYGISDLNKNKARLLGWLQQL